jgi:hypothetical protein
VQLKRSLASSLVSKKVNHFLSFGTSSSIGSKEKRNELTLRFSGF